MARRKESPVADGLSKEYMLNMKDGTRQKITIPSHWTLTFGSILPFSSKSENTTHHAGSAIALRVYEGEAQRAVFTGVESFRDMSIPISIEVTKAQDHVAQVNTPAGAKNVTMRAEVKEWRNPDDADVGSADLKLLRLGGSSEVGMDAFEVSSPRGNRRG